MAIGPLYRAFVQVCLERGVDVAAALRSVGLSEVNLVDPKTRLSPESGKALGAELLRRAGDPTIGLAAAARFDLDDLDLVGLLMQHASDLGAALDALVRYGRLLGDTALCSVERTPSTLTLTVGRTGQRVFLHEASDYSAGIVARALGSLSTRNVRPIAVKLPRPRPAKTAPYRAFFGCAVSFDAESVALTYSASDMAAVTRASHPRLMAHLRAYADTLLAALPIETTFVDRVRSDVARGLVDGAADVTSIARALSMSERTLRRKLNDAGWGYRELLEDVRRERALTLAREGGHGSEAMARKTGFADATSFARAFRRWTGVSPSHVAQSSSSLAEARTQRRHVKRR